MSIKFNPENKLSFQLQDLHLPKSKKLSTSQFNIGEELLKISSKKTTETSTGDIKTKGKKTKNKTDNLKASNGMTYKEAKAKMKSIEQKYFAKSKDDGYGGMFSNSENPYLKEVQDPSPKVGNTGATYSVYRYHYEVNADALPEPDRTEYIKAKAAADEIERNNSATFAEKKLEDPFEL